MFSRFFGAQRRAFDSLDEREVLALAISSEEDDARIYRAYAENLCAAFPHSAAVFEEMAREEDQHRAQLIEAYRARFGEQILLIRREHVRGFYQRKPDWLVRPLGLDKVRAAAEAMEEQAARFYLETAKRTRDAGLRKLLGDLAAAEQGHESLARRLSEQHLDKEAVAEEDATAHKQMVLTYVQPGLAGLMDGSVSTLAPIFAAAFATGDTWQTFLVGLAEPDLYLDAFNGGLLLSAGDCRRQVAESFGSQVLWQEEYLAPCTNREILFRMLTNLKYIFFEHQDFRSAVGVLERLVLINPSMFDIFKELAWCHLKLGERRAASEYLDRYIQGASSTGDPEDARRQVQAMWESLAGPEQQSDFP